MHTTALQGKLTGVGGGGGGGNVYRINSPFPVDFILVQHFLQVTENILYEVSWWDNIGFVGKKQGNKGL